jgi:hypothetical protein
MLGVIVRTIPMRGRTRALATGLWLLALGATLLTRPALAAAGEPAGDDPAASGAAAARAPGEDDRPLGFAGRSPIPPREARDDSFMPIEDRWRIGFPRWIRHPGKPGEYPFYEGHWWDPYGQNVLKGDYPIWGQEYFFNFTGISDTLFEARRIPTPTGLSTDAPGNEQFFGQSEQLFFNQNFALSFELFKGDSQFKPRDWEIRITPVFNVNYLDLGEQLVNVSPAEGSTRLDGHIGVQEASFEYHLADISPHYDFVSTRAGIQAFTSDFRGFVFSDFNLGFRFFGNYEANRWQYNLAYFRPLEKNTNSGLNILDANKPFDSRQQDVVVANVYRQDTIWYGYTTAFSFHWNRDHADRAHFNNNGFLVRPAPIGTVAVPGIRFHDIDVFYLGWAGDGHIGRLNVNHAVYQALGRDQFNPIAGRRTRINAQLAALELSVDRDWVRFKGSFLYASGDNDATDANARGFDAITDNVNFAGSPFSYWGRQGLLLTGAPTGLVDRFSVLPNLRTSKFEGQPNFVNPGLFLYNVGLDLELTPKLRAFANLSFLQFADTDSLERLLEQRNIRRNIGFDYSLALQYRPLLTDNIILQGGAAALTPAGGFRDVLIGETLYSTFVAATLTY